MLGTLIENWGDPVAIKTHIPAIASQIARAAVTMWFEPDLPSFVTQSQHLESFGLSGSPYESKHLTKEN